MGTPCFLLEPTRRVRRYLRRFSNDEHRPCPDMPGRYSFHNARVYLDTVEDRSKLYGRSRLYRRPPKDKRWPTRCSCGYRFVREDHWQRFTERVLRVTAAMPGGPKVGTKFTLAGEMAAPPGAMWFADWMDVDRYKGPDGHTLMCRTPGGDWMIDGVASNCTKPEDHEHRCWVRTGTPPDVTAGKGGNTCSAGAGSIRTGDYHGFLQNGFLT